MDLQQEWKEMSSEMISINPISTEKTIQIEHSNNLMDSILFKLKWKIRWIRIIDLPILVLAIFVQGDLKFLLIAFFLIYEFARTVGVKELNRINTSLDYSLNTKHLLHNNLQAVQKILRMEDIWSYFFLPLAGPLGFLAYQLMIHHKLSTVLHLPNLWLHLSLLTLIGIPFIVIGKKLNKHLFDAHIKEMKQKITDLED